MSRNVQRWGLLIITLMILGILLAVAPFTHIPFWGIDVYTFRAAAKAMMMGADPYHAPNIPRFADGVTVGDIHNYLYAPYFAFVLRPLVWLPPEAVSRIWFALNLLLFFVSVGLLLLVLDWAPQPNTFFVIIVGLILFPPLRTTLVIGQSTILLLFFFALSLFLLRQGRPFVGGLIFSLGLFKPHLFPLLLFFAIYKHWRWLWGAGVGLAVLNLSFLGWIDNWLAAAAATRTANLAVDQCFQMVSLVSLLNCTVAWPEWLIIAILGLMSLALFLRVWITTSQAKNCLKTKRQIFDQHLAIFITLMLLLIDHTRIADQMLLVFPLLVMWRDWPARKAPVLRWVAMFLMLVIYVLPYSLDFLGPNNVAYLLPFWYIGLTGAVLGILLLEWKMNGEGVAS